MGRDVEACKLEDSVGLIERHPECGACAAVVASDHEPLEAEVGHDVELILAHATKRIVAAVLLAARLAAVAVTPQIGGDHGEVAREPRRDLVPVYVRERVAVQQQHSRALSADPADDLHFRVRSLDLESLEAFVHGANTFPCVHYVKNRGLPFAAWPEVPSLP